MKRLRKRSGRVVILVQKIRQTRPPSNTAGKPMVKASKNRLRRRPILAGTRVSPGMAPFIGTRRVRRTKIMMNKKMQQWIARMLGTKKQGRTCSKTKDVDTISTSMWKTAAGRKLSE